MTVKPIICPSCEEECGKLYPATHIDPSYSEGIGENFVSREGFWCCSEFCRDVMNGEFDDEGDEELQ